LKIIIRKWLTFSEYKLEEAGQPHPVGLRKTAIVAIVKNPFSQSFQADLSEGIHASAAIGKAMAEQLLRAHGSLDIESYGKGGIVGVGGEQEHANALLTTTFAEPIRDAIGGAKAWISSVTKVAAAGTPIDIPLAHKNALYVRSNYDAMTLCIPGGPLADEIALIFVVANRGRLNARVGGLPASEVQGSDGLY
jgi:hypothetical protein